MGVEYVHYLVVNEPDWHPQGDTAVRVEAVLQEWGLVDRLKRAVDLTGGRSKELKDATTSARPGAGIAFFYDGVSGQAVERIAGPSSYDVASSERYTMDTVLTLGEDYRILPSSESIGFDVVSPPTVYGIPIRANDDEFGYEAGYVVSFPTEGATSPPIVKIRTLHGMDKLVVWDSFQGFWRGAIGIDFGKDLPAFSEERLALPERRFVSAIGKAFRGRIVELGRFY